MDHLEGWQKAEMDLQELSGGEGVSVIWLAFVIAANSAVWGLIGFLAGRLL